MCIGFPSSSASVYFMIVSCRLQKFQKCGGLFFLVPILCLLKLLYVKGIYNLILYSALPSFPLYIFPYSSVSLMLLLMLDLFSLKKTPSLSHLVNKGNRPLSQILSYADPVITAHFFLCLTPISHFMCCYIITLPWLHSLQKKNICLLVNIKGELDCFLSGGVLRRPSQIAVL